MDRKFSLAVIALVGIGVFALPSTIALFAGQHTFYNIDASGNQIPCQKCHGDVKVELSGQATNPVTGTKGPHANFQCEYCHRAEAGAASGDNAYGWIRYQDENETASTTRYLAVTMYDFESKNWPETINGSDTAVSGLKDQYKLSGTTGVEVLTANRARQASTYNRSSGQPLDTNPNTKNTGLRLNNSNWVVNVTSGSGTLNLTGAGSKAVNPGTRYHAASLVSCMECHGGEYPLGHSSRLLNDELVAETGSTCAECHYGPSGRYWTDLAAGGFGLTDTPGDTGEAEAHNWFVRADSGGILRTKDMLIDNTPNNMGSNVSNAACVACHTHVAVDINFQKKYKIKLDANAFDDGNWGVGGYAAEGTVDISVYGNGTGSTFAISNHSINWNPGATTLYIGGDRAKVIQGLNNATDDDEAALTATP